jgi:hypothetical protein
VLPVGYAYKDVVQPFVVAEWLKRNPLKTIRIKRNVADVAYSMLQRRWHYPRQLFPEMKKLELALVRGLVMADKALDSIQAEQLDFEELIADEEPLLRTLLKFYEDLPITRLQYIDDKFAEKRSHILKRKKSRKYQELEDYVAEARRGN